MNKQEIEALAIATMEKEGWHVDRTEDGSPLFLSEGSLAVACIEAGVAAALRATAVSVVGSGPEDAIKILEGLRQGLGAGAAPGSGLHAEVEIGGAIIDACIDALAALSPSPVATEGAGQGWVRVEDGLPEVQKTVSNGWLTLYHSDMYLVVVEGKTERTLHYCNEKGQWRPFGLEFHGHYAQVTHWMPLPAAPQPQKGGQPHA